MPIYYKNFTSEIIDTQDLFYALRENYENIDRKLLIEFRIQLEDLLFDKRAVSVKFHPIHWQYHKGKFLNPRKDDWYDEKKIGNVFSPDFFMQDAKLSDEITFDSLSDDDKIQIIVPENYESLKLEEREIILNRLKSGSTSAIGDDDDNPYEWSRWGYDLYSLYESCKPNFNKDRDYFEYFFAWRLSVTDLFLLKPFLHWHLNKTFKNKKQEFIDFIEILLLKYERIITNPHITTKSKEFMNETNKLIEEQKNNGKEEPKIDNIKEKSGQITTAQIVLIFMILNMSKHISKSQDRKPFQDLIASVSGLGFADIGKFMSFFNKENNFLLQKSKKQNLKDYQVVRNYFSKMENNIALEFIDNQIITINSLEL